MQCSQVHHRAGIEKPPEVRQPAFSRRVRDEVERSAVDRNEHDARLPLAVRHIERRIDSVRGERLDDASSAQHHRGDHRARGND